MNKICRFMGCDKILNNMEYLHGNYCYKHAQLINQSGCIVEINRFNEDTHEWKNIATVTIRKDDYEYLKSKFSKFRKIRGLDYYRYDIIMDGALEFSVYYHSQNLLV